MRISISSLLPAAGNGAQVYMTWALFGALVAVGAVDIYLLQRWGPEATITTYIRRIARDYPIVPFAAGVLAGHLFWGG